MLPYMNLFLWRLVNMGGIVSYSMPAQLPDSGKDPLEDVAAVASQDPEPLPPEVYTEPLQLDKSQHS